MKNILNVKNHIFYIEDVLLEKEMKNQTKWPVDHVFESKIPDSEINCTPLLDRSSKRDYEKREAKRRGSAPELEPKISQNSSGLGQTSMYCIF